MRYAPVAAVRLHPATECARGLSPGPRSGASQHDARETPQGKRRCLRRPARRTERDDHWLAAPAGERQPLADHHAPGAHQVADDHDRVREVAVRPGAEASTLPIIGIAVKRGLALGADGYEVSAGYDVFREAGCDVNPRLERGGSGDQRTRDRVVGIRG